MQHSRSKHIAINYHFVREALSDGAIRLKHWGTDEQVANIFTKLPSKIKYEELRVKLGVSVNNLEC